MLLLETEEITDVHVNLAIEEHVLRTTTSDDDIMLFYVNEPAIVVGRNQNTIEEIDPDAVAAGGMTVARRITGGGAVYHDLGNLNVSFLTPSVHSHFNHYDHFTGPVVHALRGLGVEAKLGARGAIFVNERKISGSAQFATPKRLLSHSTLLVDVDTAAVTAALRPKPGTVESKSVKSVRSRIANIRELTRERVTVPDIRERILESIFGTRVRARIPTLPLTSDDWDAIHRLVARKYGTWAWTYGENPRSTVERAQRFPNGELRANVEVEANLIVALRLTGEATGSRDCSEIETRLGNVRFERAAIEAALDGVDVAAYLEGIRADALSRTICG